MRKVISVLSVIAMVLSVLITPLIDLPAGRSPGTVKVYAAENLTGTAYAVFNSGTGELDFIRSTERHINGDTGTVKSISGGSYTGTIYTGFEENTKSYDDNTAPSPWKGVANQVKIVKFIDNIKPTTTSAWFSRMENCTSIDLKKMITSQIVDMNYMFNNCSGLTSLDVSNFDTSKVTNMGGMFRGCSGLTSLDVSKFDTSKVTSMGGMFYVCSGLTSLDVSKFDTNNVTNMASMFRSCSGLTSLDVNRFNTSNVTDMGYMFSGCSGLTSLDVNRFNTSNVTDMGSMFRSCSGLTSLDVSNFDTSKVTYMRYMFNNCPLSKLTLGKFFVISSNIKNTRGIFPTPIMTSSGGESDGTWGLDSEHAAKTYTADELTTLGKTAGALNGTWYAQVAGTYTIKFDPNGGSGTMANETMTVGKAQPLTANAFTKTGYLLKSWNTKQDGSGTSYADKASVKDLGAKDSTVTLYAQWEPKTYKNTISHWLYGFKNQEGNNGSKDAFYLGDSFFEGVFGKGTTLDSSKGITLPNGISLSNYLGYNDPTTGKWVSSTIPNTVTQPDKAMAYQLNYSPIAYKLTYNLLGGSNDSANPSSYNVLYGVTLKDAKRTGYDL